MYEHFWKRLIDIVLSTIGIIVAGIPMLVVALIIKIDSPGPVFFKQGRRTINGRVFSMLKFRSMIVNAEKMGAGLFNYENDPRVTKVGRFLRNSSIDELPQLFNIIVGDMSVVGPRPLIVNELSMHDGLRLYQKVKPGITGWWGCNGRSNIEYRERLELEYYYVKNISLYLDVLCIFRTVFAVFKRDGAE